MGCGRSSSHIVGRLVVTALTERIRACVCVVQGDMVAALTKATSGRVWWALRGVYLLS